MMGPYSAFKQCEVYISKGYEMESDTYPIKFVFKDGYESKGHWSAYKQRENERIAQEINEWWKTNPYNTTSQLIPAAPVQVLVQQPPMQGTSMPVGGGQVTYVQVQQLVAG